MKLTLIKKILPALLLGLALLAPTAQAAFDAVFITNPVLQVNETNPVLITSAQSSAIANQTTAVSTAQESTQTIFEWAQTFVVEELKKRVLDMMVDQIVGWAQGDGEPKFVTDWGAFLSDVGQAAVGDLVKELGLGFLCDPFSVQLRLSLGTPQRFSKQVECTLDKIIANVQGFFDNFKNGGWIAYSESWRPQNNFFGALLMSGIELENRKIDAEGNAWSEAVAGGGFLSTKDGAGQITTPGSVVGSLVSKAVGSDIDYIVNADQLQAYVSAIADAFINRFIKEGINGLQGVSTPKSPSGGSISSSQKGPCAGLSGSTLDSCLSYNRTVNNSFSTGKTNILDQIRLTLSPRQDAKNIINSIISKLEKYNDSLNKIYGDLFILQPRSSFNPICNKSKTQLQQEILDETNYAQNTTSSLRQDLNNNQAIIDSLLNAQSQIQSIPENDWASLTSAVNNAQGQLNAPAADNFKNSAKNKEKEISDRINEKLASFNEQISQCYQ